MASNDNIQYNVLKQEDIIKKQNGFPQISVFVASSFFVLFMVIIYDLRIKSPFVLFAKHMIVALLICLFPVFLYICHMFLRKLYHSIWVFIKILFTNIYSNLSHLISGNVFSLFYIVFFIILGSIFLQYIPGKIFNSQTDVSITSNLYTAAQSQNHKSVSIDNDILSSESVDPFSSAFSTIALIILILIAAVIYFWYYYKPSQYTLQPVQPIITPASLLNPEIRHREAKPEQPNKESTFKPSQSGIAYPGVVENTPLSKNVFTQEAVNTLSPFEYTMKDVEDCTYSNPRVIYEYYQRKQERLQQRKDQQEIERSQERNSKIDLTTSYRQYKYMPATPLHSITTSITEPGYCDISKAYLLLKELGLEDTYRFIYERLQKKMSIFVNERDLYIHRILIYSHNFLFSIFLIFDVYIIQRLLYLAQDDYFSNYQYDHVTEFNPDNPNSVVMTDSEIMLRLFFMYLASLLHDDCNALYDNYVLLKEHVINPSSTYISKLHIRLDNVNPPHYNIYYDNQRWNMLDKKDNIFVTMICFIAAIRSFDKTINGYRVSPVPSELLDIFIHY